MADKSIELKSPKKVFSVGVLGIAVAIAAFLLWTPAPDEETFRWIVIGAGVFAFAYAWRQFSDPHLAWSYFRNSGRTVADLIKEWKPKPYRLEREYEQDLHAFLKGRIRFEKVTRQYGAARNQMRFGCRQ